MRVGASDVEHSQGRSATLPARTVAVRLRDGKRGLRSEAFDVAQVAFGEADSLLGQAVVWFDRGPGRRRCAAGARDGHPEPPPPGR